MRISDWSSDVCSSDLESQGIAPGLMVDGQITDMSPALQAYARLGFVFHAYLPNPIVPGSQSDSGEYATTSARPTASSAMKGRKPRTTSDKRARVIPWMVNNLSQTGGVLTANSIQMTKERKSVV